MCDLNHEIICHSWSIIRVEIEGNMTDRVFDWLASAGGPGDVVSHRLAPFVDSHIGGGGEKLPVL